jgi:hypothetical protein
MKIVALAALFLIAVGGCQAAPRPNPASLAPGGPQMVYELRTYTAHEGRLEDLQRRFRDHTLRFFERHGMTNIGYWVPDDPELSGSTLMYVIAHADRAAATRNWEAFRADPEWLAARAASEVDGPLVLRVESVFLNPTDYSPLK